MLLPNQDRKKEKKNGKNIWREQEQSENLPSEIKLLERIEINLNRKADEIPKTIQFQYFLKMENKTKK